MAMDRVAVIKIAGSDPERFWIVGVDLDPADGKPNMKIGDDMSEEELRGKLAAGGWPTARIEAAIQKARENPL